MSAAPTVVLTTCPDRTSAERLADGLVESGCAACVNILPEVRSIYRWQGKIERDQEILLIIKTTDTAYAMVETLIRERHPYEMPEIIGLPVTRGAPAYLAWLEQMTDEAQ